MPRYSKLSLFLQTCPPKCCINFSSPLCLLHSLPISPLTPLFNHPNNIWWLVRTRNLRTVPFSPICYQFLLLKPNTFLSNATLARVLSVITETNNATADNCQSQLQPISARRHHHQVTKSIKNRRINATLSDLIQNDILRCDWRVPLYHCSWSQWDTQRWEGGNVADAHKTKQLQYYVFYSLHS